MLDTETKRRIDTARDILVGKVPDPKSQVEQITIALIYKFMDDMDAEAVELGGKRKFFTGQYAGYRWSELMKLGGNDKYTSYSEGITKMTQNESLPELFRNIFKNAYLPYRDPETLNAFLKIIDQFSYDHSERLGDAFEYLLSVLGSQGDAGQFRTPRHIIDFMVEVLAPKKTETVLDPACGTAGFLISAYKHILRTNTDAKGRSTLTPDDKGRLAKNIKGYDISPDMVRLSLVNLYLHGFTDPHIYEYDSLTQEERWNEYADVILANPPFMSPKGGIKPHKRFSIQAKRSEVLFVDYMAEHLNPQGRAAIIVPEGIIFQSQTAYTELRKMLVEHSLVAVISLPAGCFNPYSGVKTSILILDKSLAKQSHTIAFFKVENDGFGLGAQRRAIEKNDLPQVQAELTAYLKALRSGATTDNLLASASTAQIVSKEKVAANGDYNLSGERYREGADTSSQKWPTVRLDEVCETITDGDHQPPPKTSEGVPFVTISNISERGELDFTKTFFVPESYYAELKASRRPRSGDILYTVTGSYGIAALVPENVRFCFQRHIALIRPGPQLLNRFLFELLASPFMLQQGHDAATGVAQKTVSLNSLRSFTIPLPPLEVQKEIVAEIEGYQKVINGARAVLDHYRPHIPIHPDWPMVRIDSIASVQGGVQKTRDRQPKKHHRPYLTVRNVQRGYLDLTQIEQFEVTPAELNRLRLELGDILIVEGNGSRDQIGRGAMFDISGEEWIHQNHLIRVRLDRTRAVPHFMSVFLNSQPGRDQMLSHAVTSSGLYTLSVGKIGSMEVPCPPLLTQQAIVAEIEAEQALVAANRELITRFEHKIQTTLARIWGVEKIED